MREKRQTEDLKATENLVEVLLLDADLVGGRGGVWFARKRVKKIEDSGQDRLKTLAVILDGHSEDLGQGLFVVVVIDDDENTRRKRKEERRREMKGDEGGRREMKRDEGR